MHANILYRHGQFVQKMIVKCRLIKLVTFSYIARYSASECIQIDQMIGQRFHGICKRNILHLSASIALPDACSCFI